MSEFRDHLLDQARHPRHHAPMTEATFCQHEANPSCGDVIDLYVRISDEGKVEALSFTGTGCVISLAASSLFTEVMQDKFVDEILALGDDELMKSLGLEIGLMRRNCALLPLNAFRKGFVLWQKDSSSPRLASVGLANRS